MRSQKKNERLAEEMHGINEVLEELCKTVKRVSYEEEVAIASAIQKTKRVFVAGSGRSGLIASCFAMRLMQSGITAYRVGECTTPAIEADDLLIITSGSGETGALVKNAETARQVGSKIALITIYPESTIGKMSDVILQIAAFSKFDKEENSRSVQPMGSLFEQSLMICLDYIMMILMEQLGLSGESMFQRHANLE